MSLLPPALAVLRPPDRAVHAHLRPGRGQHHLPRRIEAALLAVLPRLPDLLLLGGFVLGELFADTTLAHVHAAELFEDPVAWLAVLAAVVDGNHCERGALVVNEDVVEARPQR